MRSRSIRALLAATAVMSLSGGAMGQFYSFTSGPGGDGFFWDEFPQGGLNNLSDTNQFDTPDGVSFNNFTNNNSFFDDNYLAAGNAPNISGAAWWGNPLDSGGSPELYIGFFNSPTGGAGTLSFDFAWALAGEDATDYIELLVYDYDTGPGQDETYEQYVYIDLNEVWNAGGAFGGFNGRSGNVYLDINDLYDDNSGEPFTEIDDVGIFVSDIATFGGTGEFAIDNVSIDGSSGGNGSNVVFTGNSGEDIFADGTNLVSNFLRKPGTATFFSIRVTENGGEDTTYTVEMVPGGDLTPGTLANGDFIAANSDDFVGTIGSINQNAASGQYVSEIILTNDQNPLDPDNNLFVGIALHDAPQLSGSQSVNVSSGQQVTLANAAATPGGLRAGVEITSTIFTGGFSFFNGVVSGVKVLPGESVSTTSIAFDRYGKRNGTYNGSVTVSMDMKSQTGFFLSDADAIDRVYNLSYTLGTTSSDSVGFINGESFGPGKVGVNNAGMAATLIGGTSSSEQNVTMTLGTNPEASNPSADLAVDPVDLSFDIPGDLHVLQFTYDPANLPAGMAEADLIPLVYHTGSSDWVDATDLNSDGGSGAALFLGSFEDFFAGPGGGTLDAADLSFFGVDSANDQAWAILDHNSLFAIGRLAGAPLPGDTDGDGDVDDADLGTMFSNFTGPVGGAGGKTAMDGDTDGDGDVDDADLANAFSAFTGPLGPTTVPEPASLALLAIGALACSRRRR